MTRLHRRIRLLALFCAAAFAATTSIVFAAQTASAPLALFAPGADAEARLALRVNAESVVVRVADSPKSGEAAFSITGWAGSFDVDESKLALAAEGGGIVAADSLRAATSFDADGRVAEFQLAAVVQLKAGEASTARPIQVKVRVEILTLRMERRPVAAYLEEGSLKLDELGDNAVYEFNVVYDASASATPVRCALNRDSVVSEGSFRRDGEFKPFADEFKPGDRKTYPVIVPMSGASPADRRGVYRSATVAYDLFGRPFLVEYAVQLSPELVAKK